jgi:hypothetical protein
MNEVAVEMPFNLAAAPIRTIHKRRKSLANATVAHRILQCLLNGFFCGRCSCSCASESRANPNLLTAIAPGCSSFYSRHRTFSLIKK